MVSRLSHFVPLEAYVFQAGVMVLGGAFLVTIWPRAHCKYLLGMAFPAGFGIVGFVQWLLFALGKASLAPRALFLVVLGCLGAAMAAGWRHRQRPVKSTSTQRPSRAESWVLGLLVAGLMAAGIAVSQSSGLSEDDPRWQWGFRAKIVANEEGFGSDFYQDTSLYHINPHYPLLYSAYEGFMLRVLGDSERIEAVRAIPVFFLFSCLLLTTTWARSRCSVHVTSLVMLLMVCMGKFWSLIIDANYVDFPLGVCALTVLLLLKSQQDVHWGCLASLALMAGVTASMKGEGVVLLGACLAGWLAIGRPNRTSVIKKVGKITAVLLGAALAMGLQRWSLDQMATDWPIENVTLSAFKLSAVAEGIWRIPTILSQMGGHIFEYRDLGLLLPILILLAPLQGRQEGKTATLISGVYLVGMCAPFVVSNYYEGNYVRHIQVTATRLVFQVLPIIWIALLAGIQSWTESSRMVQGGVRK